MTSMIKNKSKSSSSSSSFSSRSFVVVVGKVILVACILRTMFQVMPSTTMMSLLQQQQQPSTKTTTSIIEKQGSKSSSSYLMIVSHPDDEAIWGGEFLIENGSKTHVVVTSGESKYISSVENKEIRYKEFMEVANLLDFSPEFLYGRDRFEYRKNLERSIKRRIRQLICNKSWDKIITHGPEGEYGHPTHHNVYDAVSEAIQYCCHNSDKLYVFHSTLPPVPRTMKPSTSIEGTGWSEIKIKAMEKYVSQRNTLFNIFLGWTESIVPIKQYNYTLASETCLAKGMLFCRIHKYIDASTTTTKQTRKQQKQHNKLAKDFHLFYGLNGETLIHENQFHHKGVGSC